MHSYKQINIYISEFWMYNTVWKSRPLYFSQIYVKSVLINQESQTAILFRILTFSISMWNFLVAYLVKQMYTLYACQNVLSSKIHVYLFMCTNKKVEYKLKHNFHSFALVDCWKHNISSRLTFCFWILNMYILHFNEVWSISYLFT